MDEITVSVLPPHLKMIDHGVVAGDRASHLTSVQYCMAVAALAPDPAFELRSPPEPPPAVRGFMAKIHGRGGRAPARRLSTHLAGTGASPPAPHGTSGR
jgi:hypothetical protein